MNNRNKNQKIYKLQIFYIKQKGDKTFRRLNFLVKLFSKFYTASFPDNVNFNLSGIFHFAFNLFSDIASQNKRICI